MNTTLTVLLIIAILILALGIITLGVLLVMRSSKADKLFKETIIESNKETFDVINNINMRLISILTEITTSNPPITNSEVQDHMANIKAQDDEIIRGILNPEPSEPFDPFQAAEKIQEESNDTLLESSAVYNEEPNEKV